MSEDIDKLKRFAMRVHKTPYPFMKFKYEQLERITFDTYRLLRTNYSDPIRVDTIFFMIPTITLIPFVLCKGLTPDCIFYLTTGVEGDFDDDPLALKFKFPVCNITFDE